MITYNSPITDGSVVCPEQLFRNAPVPVDQASITDAASLLISRAQGICTLLSIDGGQSGDSFMANHNDVIGSISAVAAILDQLDAAPQQQRQKVNMKKPTRYTEEDAARIREVQEMLNGATDEVIDAADKLIKKLMSPELSICEILAAVEPRSATTTAYISSTPASLSAARRIWGLASETLEAHTEALAGNGQPNAEALALNDKLAKLAIRAGNELVQELDKVKYREGDKDA